MADAWTSDVLTFWFSLRPEQWWTSDSGLDEQIRERFLDLWTEQRQKMPDDFLGSAETALAAIILFDQFPRNMFRGHADSFSTDHIALAIARKAVERGNDERYSQPQRGFFYMPFQHSEDLQDQQRSLTLFTALGDDDQLRFAKLHHDIVERFGRFPHRNRILGRQQRPDEIAAGDVTPW